MPPKEKALVTVAPVPEPFCKPQVNSMRDYTNEDIG